MPSRDFSRVALLLSAHKADRQQTLAVVNSNGTDYREITKLDPNPYLYSVTWSWDNRSILVDGFVSDPGRLLRISVADGKIHEENCKPFAGWPVFSPDGRFIAYRGSKSRIFILAVSGGQPQAVYQESPVAANSNLPVLFDWTADGHYLAIGSERTGKRALYLLPSEEGKSSGSPIFVRYGDFEFARTTATGELVYITLKPDSASTIHLAILARREIPQTDGFAIRLAGVFVCRNVNELIALSR